MQRKRGLVLQPNSQSKASEPSEGLVRPAKRARGEEEVGYPNLGSDNSRSAAPNRYNMAMVEASIKEWVWAHLEPGIDSPSTSERRNALLEVGQLMITEGDQYPTAVEIKEEIAELVSQLGGQDLLDSFIAFLLDLRMRSRSHPQHPMGAYHGMMPMYPPGMHGMPFFPYPPEFYPPVPPQFGGHPFMPPGHFQGPMPGAPGRGGNLVLSRSNEPTAVQKLKEREAKRKELLQTYTEELKLLVAKTSEAPDEQTKQRYLDFIEAVKKKIGALSAAAPAPARPHAKQPPAGIVGYFGNQYINPAAKAAPKPDATD
jgi:hypothetical protein